MQNYKPGSYLSQIENPSDLKSKFKVSDLPHVSADVRQYIIDVISDITYLILLTIN